MDIQSIAADVRSLQAPLIGSFISLIFYGVSCVQTLFYFQTYPGDHILLKCLIAVIWILESAHCGFMISFNNSYLIDGFGDLLTPQIIAWFCSHPRRELILYLASVVSRNVWLVNLLVFIEISRYVLSTASSSLAFHVDVTWKSFKDHAYAPLAVSMGVATLGDTLITLTLAYHLHSKRTQSSTQLVTRLLAYVVGTGALTSMFSIVKLISILASPNTLLYVLFTLIQVKIYANSILLSLNLRQYQRRQDVVLSLGVPNITLDDRTTLIC
ncbi:hypothetical protein J3A83DRAFT_2911308 [Scleroderma citrinum]